MTEGLLSLQKMQIVSWLVLSVMSVGSAVFMSLAFGLSVLVGGIISISSFFVSNMDIMKLVESVTSISSPEDRKAKAQQEQKGYLLKFWLRIVIIGVVLFVLIKWQLVNIFGLILGLSTVVVAITLISISVAGHYLFRGRR